MKPIEIAWSWCDLCEVVTAICPTCQTNSCGVSRGTVNGEPCPDCPATWEAERLARKQGTVPFFREQCFAYFGPEPSLWDVQMALLPRRRQRCRRVKRKG